MGQILLRVSITGRETEAEGSLFRRGDVMKPQCSMESPPGSPESRGHCSVHSSWARGLPAQGGTALSSRHRPGMEPARGLRPWEVGGVPPPCECDLQVDVRVSFTFTPGWWPSRPRERQPRAEAHSVVARQWPRPCPPSSGICPEPGHTVGSLLAFPFCLFLKFFQSNIWRRGIQVHQGCESPREQQPR